MTSERGAFDPRSARPADLASVIAGLPADWLRARRWFGRRTSGLAGLRLVDAALLPGEALGWLVIADALFDDGTTNHYFLPLVFHREGERPNPIAAVAAVGGWAVHDGLGDAEFCLALLAAIERGAGLDGERGAFHPTAEPALDRGLPANRLAPRPAGAEQSNSAVVYGDQYVLKVFRRPMAGLNPDVEIARYLARHDFAGVPALAGDLEYRSGSGLRLNLALLQRFVPNEGDGWDWAVAALSADRAEAILVDLDRLGRTTADLHLTLARGDGTAAFASTGATADDLAVWSSAMIAQVEAVAGRLRAALPALAPADRALAERVLAGADGQRGRFALLAGHAGPLVTMRIHGDYHLGQVLKTADGFVVIDFEGEPSRPLHERRRKQSPLRDLAGMIRSFDYAAQTAVRGGAAVPAGWVGRARSAFLDGYFAQAEAGLFPEPDRALALLDLFAADKAWYEVGYELDNRPKWVGIPLAYLNDAMGR